MHSQPKKGFSLVEMLITIALLGVLSTFAIPSVLNSADTQSAKKTEMARTTAYALLSAYEAYRSTNGTVPTNMPATTLLPYLNYVSISTTSSIDGMNNEPDIACTSTYPCLNLPSGGKLMQSYTLFGGTASTNSVFFYFDPDGLANESTTNGPGNALKFALYYDGTIRSRGTVRPNTTNGSGNFYNPGSGADPSWFMGF